MVLPGEEDRERGTFPDHPAMRLVIRHSPALFQLEMAGSAAFQMEGSLALLGHDLLRLNLDTVGLWFRPPGSTDVQLLQENNLNQSFGSGSATEIAALGQKLRRFLDPRHPAQISEVPKGLSGNLSCSTRPFSCNGRRGEELHSAVWIRERLDTK